MPRHAAALILLLLAVAALPLANLGRTAHPGAPSIETMISTTETRRPGSPKSYSSPGERAEFFEEQRRPIDGSDYSPAQLFEALEDIRARQRAQAIARGGVGPGDILGWAELGPGNVGGRTRTLVFDPNDPDIMYSGGVSGGVWKTIDGGATWFSLDDTMINLAVTTIVMDPTNPSILYAGTGEGFFQGSGPAGRGFGVFKTTDAGATWTQLPDTANGFFYYVNELVISPNDPLRVYAGTRTGVWRTTDGGTNWDIVLANPGAISAPAVQNTNGCIVGCTDMVIRSDSNPDVLWAGFGSWQDDGLYLSNDGGTAWIQYTVPAQQGRMQLALAPSDNDILYLCMADNGAGGQTGRLVQLYRTIDGGASFTPQADLAGDPFAPNLLTNMVIALGCFEYMSYSQGWYDNALAVDPTNPDIVWVGGIALSRSNDAGATWGRAAYYFGYDQTSDPFWVHPDFHGVFFHPDYNGTTNQTMFVSNDGGLYKTDNALAAVSTELCPEPPASTTPAIAWQDLNNSYAVTQFYHGDSSPLTDLFIGGTQDNGTNAVGSASDPNGWNEIFGGDGGYVAIDPTNPDVIYVEIQFFPEMRKSTDGGQTFADAVNGITDTDGIFITPFAMDQNDPDILWTGGSRPWRTTNGAALWELAQTTSFPGQISAIAIAPSDSNTVYLGLNNGYVYRSTNALDPNPTWTGAGSLQGLIVGAYASSMAVHPTNPDIAYLTYSNYAIPHVYKTTDGGASWNSLDGAAPDNLPDIPAHWIAVSSSNPDQLYVATELGVFASDDTGATWQPTGLGLPNTIVESLDFQDDDTLVAFTHGRGAWRTSLLAPPPVCPGDINGDGVTDVFDFSLFSAAFGSSIGDPGYNPDADLDNSGTVDVLDFSIFAPDFGCPSN